MPLHIMLDDIPQLHDLSKTLNDTDEFVDFWNILDDEDNSEVKNHEVEFIDVDGVENTFVNIEGKSESIVAKMQSSLFKDVSMISKQKQKGVNIKKKIIFKDKSEDHKCTSCDRKFKKELSLKMHMGGCSKPKSVFCSQSEGDVEKKVETVKQRIVTIFFERRQ